MREIFGEFINVGSDYPVFLIQFGSTYVHVAVHPWGDDDATIAARAYVVTQVDLTSDLLHFLLQENDNMRFGAFGIDKDNDIFFEHTIVGSTCDKEELKSSIIAVGITSDQYDEKITQRWGGVRAIDRVKD